MFREIDEDKANIKGYVREKSYPERLHDIFIKQKYGDPKLTTSLETCVALLIDDIISEVREKKVHVAGMKAGDTCPDCKKEKLIVTLICNDDDCGCTISPKDEVSRHA